LRIDIVIVEAKTRLFGLVLTAQQANGAGVSHMGGCSWRGGRIDGSNVSCGSRCWWILRSSCIADSRLASDSGSAGVFKGKQRRLRVDGVSIPKGSYSIFWFFYLASSLVACIVKDRYQDCRSEEQRKQKFLRNLEGCCAGVPKGAVAIENENYMEAILACVIERQSGAEKSRDAVGLILGGSVRLTPDE